VLIFVVNLEKNGSVSIFVQHNMQFCIDQDIEVCAIKLHHCTNNICILTVYRAPTGNFLYFSNSLEAILNKIYTKSTNIILCGDININYLMMRILINLN
jgi:hypothetical protein